MPKEELKHLLGSFTYEYYDGPDCNGVGTSCAEGCKEGCENSCKSGCVTQKK